MAERARVFLLASSDPAWMDEAVVVMFTDAMRTSEEAPRRRPMSLGPLALLVFLAPALVAPATAPPPASAQVLTEERILTSSDFRAHLLVQPSWTPDGERLTHLVPAEDGNGEAGGSDLVARDVRTGETEVLVRAGDLVPEGERQPIAIEGYRFSPDGERLLIFTRSEFVWRERTRGVYYVLDLASGDLRPLSTGFGWQQFAKFSPDGGRVGFVRGNDLFVVDLASGRERRLTDTGSETVVNGTFDWAYEEELGLQDGWRWSPDGRRIAFWSLDQVPVRPFTYDLEYPELYPDPVEVRYPKAGQPNAVARIGVVGLDGGPPRWIDTGDNPDVYLARMEWAPDPGDGAASDEPTDELMIQRLNRRQNRLDVLMADPETGRSRVVISDSSDTWVEVDDHFTWIDGGARFLWSSERDGFRHLYLHERSGEGVRRLTGGSWEITEPVGVDDEGRVYFTGKRESPLEEHLYRVPLAGGEVERVTGEPGTHRVRMNPSATHFVDVHSRAGVPPTVTLREADGTILDVLRDNDDLERRLDSAGFRPPEFFRFETDDGTELHGWMIRPPDFDPEERHPLLMSVYGGPGSQSVTDAWGGAGYLWFQLMAERGYLVASVDGRGTGGRGQGFEDAVYGELGRVETRDQLAAADHLASLDYVDGDRLGVWGPSYGGYLALLAMMRGDGRFRAGIALAPVTDWRLYDTIYTERYMGLPSENPDGYARSAPLAHAGSLEGRLLLLHGSGDDNVHLQHSVRLIQRLQEEGKQFEFMLYPNETHAIRGPDAALHLYSTLTRFLLENL